MNLCNQLGCKGLEKTRKRPRGYSLVFSKPFRSNALQIFFAFISRIQEVIKHDRKRQETTGNQGVTLSLPQKITVRQETTKTDKKQQERALFLPQIYRSFFGGFCKVRHGTEKFLVPNFRCCFSRVFFHFDVVFDGFGCKLGSMKLPVELHQDGDWYVAFCPTMPEANGQGRTEDEAIESLRSSICLLIEDTLADTKTVRYRELEIA